MQSFRLGLAYLAIFALLLSVTGAPVAAADANFAGSWDMTVTGGGGGHRPGGGGGGYRLGGGEGGGAQSLTITRDGDKFKVDHKTPRGENTYDATVSGNTISWTEERESRQGNSMKVECQATLDGDTLTGRMSSGQFSRDFTAKRSSPERQSKDR